MSFSTFIVILFFLFFKTYTRYYIDELKLVYPSLYLVKEKSIESYQKEGFEVYSEIFELNLDSFTIALEKNGEAFTLGSLGLRSFHENKVPKIIQKIYTQEPTLFLSDAIYKQLHKQKDFTNAIYIQSDVDLQWHKVLVKPFTIHDNSKWILLSNKTAHILYRDDFFDKASFYSTLPEKKQKEIIEHSFQNIIYSWDDHITLLNRALKESMQYIFLLITIAILVLSISSIIFFSRELMDDLVQLTEHSFFFGVSFFNVYLAYIVVTNLTIILILLSTYKVAFSVNSFFSHALWDVSSFDGRVFILYIILAIFSVTLVTFYIKIKKLFSFSKYGLSHV